MGNKMDKILKKLPKYIMVLSTLILFNTVTAPAQAGLPSMPSTADLDLGVETDGKIEIDKYSLEDTKARLQKPSHHPISQSVTNRA